MTTNTLRSSAHRTPHALVPYGIVEMILCGLSVWSQRRALARLDADRLADLGIDPEEALREAKKPIWDAPIGWRR